ncbi:hypothetical protein LCGC14_1443420 [marine sediment metagenome]|uniref:AMP-dependent synthetase/ligase domain-containing protein n=1 Tax=marine sediment metagenome TaxID=412755 RepID=A0A0F9JJX2_9ZZZZ
MGYSEIYADWKSDPEGWWMEQARAIHWDRFPSKALDDSRAPIYEWFADGLTNTCYNAVDRHVEAGRADQVALIHDSPVTDTKRNVTFAELKDQTARLAGALRARGIEKGDRVIIYMPMIPEAIVAMLACARIGAIHSIIFGGFSAESIAGRLDDCESEYLITADEGMRGGRVIPLKTIADEAIAALGGRTRLNPLPALL